VTAQPRNWKRRFELFARFDRGIRFDKEGFEISKTEVVADFLAARLPGKVVLDAFTGLGGSAIAFARHGKRVISIDAKRARSKMAAHNAALYGMQRRIRFVVGDSLKLWRKFRFDTAYFDPPWAASRREQQKGLRFASFKPNVAPLIRKLLSRGKNCAATVPMNFDLNELRGIRRDVELYFLRQYGKPYCIHCIWPANRDRSRAGTSREP
jgi:trimethylguanosine synthase